MQCPDPRPVQAFQCLRTERPSVSPSCIRQSRQHGSSNARDLLRWLDASPFRRAQTRRDGLRGSMPEAGIRRAIAREPGTRSHCRVCLRLLVGFFRVGPRYCPGRHPRIRKPARQRHRRSDGTSNRAAMPVRALSDRTGGLRPERTWSPSE